MKRAKPQWREAVAGACSGALSRTIMAPIERVKLLQQLQHNSRSANDIYQLSGIQIARKIYLEEGLLSFWRGNVPNIVRVAGTQALNFTGMDYYKRATVIPMMDHLWPLSSTTSSSSTSQSQQQQQQQQQQQHRQLLRWRAMMTSFISGGLAGATATTLLYPFEFVRTRLAMDRGNDQHPQPIGSSSTSTIHAQQQQPLSVQNRPRRYTGMVDVMKHIIKSDGFIGFYQGYGVALLGGILYRILYLGGYDAGKAELLLYRRTNDHTALHYSSYPQQLQQQQHGNEVELTWSERFIMAEAISLVAGTIIYPFDSVRRRMMMQAGIPSPERTYRNSIHCTRQIWNTEGLRGFYLGIGPNLVRSVGGAFILVGYDGIRTLL